MQVAEILRRKGRQIHSIAADASLAAAARELWEKQAGALVVTDARGELAGILRERDLVRMVAEGGPAGLERSVGSAMDPQVVTCRPEDRVERVLRLMTLHRVRHLPVRSGEHLVGLVSMGDLVKHGVAAMRPELPTALRELTLERIG